MSTPTTSAAWGLHLTEDGARLVRLSASGGTWRITDEQTFPADAVKLPDRCGRDEPIAICVDDDATLYRTLAIPPADDAATQRMVTAQFETILPHGQATFARAWSRTAATGNGHAPDVLLTAMRTDRLDRARCLSRENVVVVPAASAVAGAIAALGASGDAHTVVHVAAHHTLVVGVSDGRITACVPIEGGAAAAKQPARSGAWLADVADAVTTLTDPKRQGECLLICEADIEPTLSAALPRRTRLMDDPVNTLAVGAAAAPLLPRGTVPVFAGEAVQTDDAKPREKPRASKRIVAGVVLLLLLVVSAVMDMRQAAHLEEAVQQAKSAEETAGSLQQRLALARHLETLGPTPTAVLHDLSARAEAGIILTRWQMSPREGVRLAGAAPNADALHSFFEALSKSDMLRNVRIVSQKFDPKKKTTTFDIEADLPPRYVPPKLPGDDKKEAKP